MHVVKELKSLRPELVVHGKPRAMLMSKRTAWLADNKTTDWAVGLMICPVSDLQFSLSGQENTFSCKILIKIILKTKASFLVAKS